MRALWANEWVKIKHSKWVIGVILYLMFMTVIGALFPGTRENYFTISGYGSLFSWSDNLMGMDIYSAFAFLVAGLMGKEFDNRTLHNIVGRGIKRKHYFAVKAICIIMLSALFYIASLCIFSVLRTMIFGYNPEALSYSDYWSKVLVYNGGALLLVLCYVSVFILLSVLIRRIGPMLVCSILINFIDSSLREGAIADIRIGGACRIAVKMRTAFQYDRILTGPFFTMFLPVICVGVVTLLLACQLFQKRDID